MWPRIVSHSRNSHEVLESSEHLALKWKHLHAFITECWPQAQATSEENVEKNGMVLVLLCANYLIKNIVTMLILSCKLTTLMKSGCLKLIEPTINRQI